MAEKHNKNVSDILGQLLDEGHGKSISLGDVIDRFGRRAYAPMIFVVAVILVSPIGGLPGATAVFGTLIILLGVQSFFSESPWVPAFIRDRAAEREEARRRLKKVLPYMKKAERLTRARWTVLAAPPWDYLSMLLIILIAATTYPLGLIPGGLIAPGLTIALLSMAKFHHDGVILAIGTVLGCGIIGFVGYAVTH